MAEPLQRIVSHACDSPRVSALPAARAPVAWRALLAAGLMSGLLSAIGACADASCLEVGACGLPCAAVSTPCTDAGRKLWVGRLSTVRAPVPLTDSLAGQADVMLDNGHVRAVISAIDAASDLAPTGGNLVELGTSAGRDELTIVYQVAGLLPDDAFAYTNMEVYDLRPERVGVKVSGTLAGRPTIRVVTWYELRPCDEGVRVHSELYNGSPEPLSFTLADIPHWGKRHMVPFVPKSGQGYQQPPLSLLDLTEQWSEAPLVAAAAPSADGVGVGTVQCNRDVIGGVSDLELSALGAPLQIVPPGQTVVFERMWYAKGQGEGVGGVIGALLLARQQLHAAPAPREIKGMVRAGGVAFGGDVRRASLMLLAADGTPLTSTVPSATGAIDVMAPAHTARYELWSFGRAVAAGDVPENGQLGELSITPPASVTLDVTVEGRLGGEAGFASVVFEPMDAATRDAVRGTFHGRFEACAPWLGPPHGASPACNRVLVEPRGTEVLVPAGRYQVIAAAGPAATLAMREVTLAAGDAVALAFTLKALELAPPGWLSADLHVHGNASFDASIPDEDRVRSFVAEGVDVIAATDHDVIANYANTVAALGLEHRLRVMGGLETTQLVPFMKVAGADLPKVIGHFNFWPLTPLPGLPRGGAPQDEFMEPGQLFDVMAPLVGAQGIMMMNHPWDEAQSGRDLGYLRAIGYDPRLAIAEGNPNSALLRVPGALHRNGDWNLIEIINGADAMELLKARTLWFSLLAKGWLVGGSGNSDSHGLTDAQLGWSRNWVRAEASLATFDAGQFNTALREGRFSAGTGVFVHAEIGPAGGPYAHAGLAPMPTTLAQVVRITVRAAPWVPVTEVRVVTSRGVKRLPVTLATPPAPFGEAGVLRYQGEVRLGELIDRDDFLLVEAGVALPLAADLDDDGVVDTTDNNGDGMVTEDDIEPDADAGPMAPQPRHVDGARPDYWLTRVIPDAISYGYANPLILDVDGAGWRAPEAP